MRKIFHVSLIIIGLVFFSGCESNTPDQLTPMSKKILTGKVQKGPFVEGSSVYIFSLNEQFSQTGSAYATSIVDKKGSFEQKNMQLNSQFVELIVNGYYFNEVKGELSTSPLTLSAIADISDADNVNVNILTTLERERILFLVTHGKNFKKAKAQAHKEVLAVFGMKTSDTDDAIELDLEEDAQLLVISAIVQGYRSAAEVTRLLSNIASDLREDGTLDVAETASMLKNNALGISAAKLVENMSKYDMTCSYVASEVEKWLNRFLTNTSYEQSEYVNYPAEDEYGPNILAGGTFEKGKYYSFSAITPSWCPLKVEVRGLGEWYYEVMPEGPENWKVSTFVTKEGYHSQTFTVVNPGQKSLLKFEPGYQNVYGSEDTDFSYSEGTPEPGTLLLLFYENSDVPTQEMVIHISSYQSGENE